MTYEQYEAGPKPESTLNDLFDGVSFAFSEIRGDWNDPRHDLRLGGRWLDALEERVLPKQEVKS